MPTILEEAIAYKGNSIKNIAEMPQVDVNMNIEDREGKNSKGEVFKYKVAVIDGEDYRVPLSVLKDLKILIESGTTVQKFKVLKSGTDMNTDYKVVPISN